MMENGVPDRSSSSVHHLPALNMADTPDILTKILRRKAEEIARRQGRVPQSVLQARAAGLPPARGFAGRIARRVAQGSTAVIAEIKKASPSKGVLRSDFDPAGIARAYEQAGAACLSVLTDRDFFQGDERFLQQARAACTLPVLRKDFIIDPYQVYESRCIGADCILLIVAALDDERLKALAVLAQELGLDVLVEVHDRNELERALALPVTLVGINNRDLHSFETRLETTLDLLPHIPDDRVVVTESGILEPAHVAMMEAAGVHAFLVGEAFMRAPDPGVALRHLFSP